MTRQFESSHIVVSNEFFKNFHNVLSKVLKLSHCYHSWCCLKKKCLPSGVVEHCESSFADFHP